MTIEARHLHSAPAMERPAVTGRPIRRPRVPHFSSGPCAKRPGWSPSALSSAALGRAHRSTTGIAKLMEVIERTRALLAIPDDHRVAIVPGSDTGAVEMALWSLLGARGVDVLVWDSFGARWRADIVEQLRLDDVRVFESDYGALPDLSAVDGGRDVVFTWNATSSGVRVPDGEWIAADRQGLAICDATSAAFAMELPWDKLDVATWSWQKALGGEAAHGTIVLSPRAVERFEVLHAIAADPTAVPPRRRRAPERGAISRPRPQHPLVAVRRGRHRRPDMGRLDRRTGGADRPFRGQSRRDRALGRADRVDSRSSLRTRERVPRPRSVSISWCPGWPPQDHVGQLAFMRRLVGLLADEGVAYDINGHRHAPPGLRIWGGPTVETRDIAALPPWLDWAFAKLSAEVVRVSFAAPPFVAVREPPSL